MAGRESSEPLLDTEDLDNFDEDGRPSKLAPGDIPSHVAKRFKLTLHLSWTACVVCFVDLSIVSPTLYPYVAKLCGSTAMYGYLLVVYSACQVIASPVFNYWAIQRTVREAMLGALFLLIIGNLLYALAAFSLEDSCALRNGSVCVPLFLDQNFTNTVTGQTEVERITFSDAGLCGTKRHTGLYMIFIGRALAGLGGGAISVSFGLFSRITRLKDRVFTFSCARTWMSLAYMLAPGLAALFAVASCTCDASTIIGSAYVNQYTLPGYATAAMSFLVFLAILAQFENPPNGGPKQVVKVFFNRGLFALILSSFLASFVVGAFSAILVPVTTHNYDWGDLDNSLFYVGVGLLLIPGSAFAMIFASTVSPRGAVVASSTALALGLLCDLFPTAGASITSYAPFFTGSFLICSGYAAVTAICPATFSMLIPPTHRQAMMAWIPTLNSVARAIGPLYGVQTYVWAKNYGGVCASSGEWTFVCGDRFTEVVLGGLVLVGVAVTLLCFNYLKVVEPPKNDAAKSSLSLNPARRAKKKKPSFMRSASELIGNTAGPPGMSVDFPAGPLSPMMSGMAPSRQPSTSQELLSAARVYEST